MLQQDEIALIDYLLVEFHDIFSRYRFDVVMDEELKVKLTPRNDCPPIIKIYRRRIFSKRAFLSNWRYFTAMGSSRRSHSQVQSLPKSNPMATTTPVRSQRNNLISDGYITNNHPVSPLADAAQHMAGRKLFCKLEMLAFNFASSTLAYRRLAQGLSQALSVFPALCASV